MRRLPHPHTGEGAAALGVFTLAALELIALSAAPAGNRPVIAGALAAAAALVLLGVAVVRHRRNRPAVRLARPSTPEAVGAEWFSAETFEGFPAEAVGPLLGHPGAPSPSSLYSAWVLAVEGHDPVWIERHFGLPPDVAHVLCEAARSRR
ncbi:hypothetical protein [Streptomyces sp. NPDC020917]|uniref:hypothetical protein n=1 Tax=Streptomyces sp. NPDC020917 TaxID=3365102 RepID=UPI0037B61DF7